MSKSILALSLSLLLLSPLAVAMEEDEALSLEKQLFTALEKGACDIETIKCLLKEGADPVAKDKYGITPLLYALGNSNTELVQLLLTKNAQGQVEIVDNQGQGPMHHAATQHSSIATLDILYKAGAKLNEIDNDGETPLDLARKQYKDEEDYGQREEQEQVALQKIQWFIANLGIQLSQMVVDKEKWPALLIRELIEKMDPAERQKAVTQYHKDDRKKRVPLHLVFKRKDNDERLLLAKLFLKHGADVNAQDNKKRTLAHRIAQDDMYKGIVLLHALVPYDPDFNIKDENEQTPLHLLLIEDKTKEEEWVMRFFLYHGANPYQRDIWGLSAFDYVEMDDSDDKERKKRAESLKLLTDYEEGQLLPKKLVVAVSTLQNELNTWHARGPLKDSVMALFGQFKNKLIESRDLENENE